MTSLKACPNCGKKEGKLAGRRPAKFPYAVVCKKAGGEFTRRIEGIDMEKITRNVVCLPEGTYPKAREVRR